MGVFCWTDQGKYSGLLESRFQCIAPTIAALVEDVRKTGAREQWRADAGVSYSSGFVMLRNDGPHVVAHLRALDTKPRFSDRCCELPRSLP